jgi:hypothetical protein
MTTGSYLRGDHIMRLRFNIATILGVILLFGVGFAALREANDYWDSGLLTLTLGVLLVAVLLAIHRIEAKRVYWIGFAIIGWCYLALAQVPPLESRLLTTKALAYLDSKIPGRSLGVFTAVVTGTGSNPSVYQLSNLAFTVDGSKLATSNQGAVRLWDVTTGTRNVLSRWSGTTEDFVRIGHSLVALIAAFVGGHLSRRLYHTVLSAT